jgi:hypothetical protein
VTDATPRHDAERAEPAAQPDLPVRAEASAGQNAGRAASSGTRPAGARSASDDQPVTPDVSLDDTDHGWGEDLRESRGGRDDDWYRRERPPHWE